MKRPRDQQEGAENFDGLLDRLRSIVERMEQGGLGLEESLKLFEEGIGLSNRLLEVLNRSEGRVEELLSTMERTPFSKGDE
jgi:exodeoxyribonuclease VII small subunit